MIKVLVAASILWPALLAVGAGARIRNENSSLGAAVYLTSGLVCHQRDERSFHTHGVKWPVCGRCSGLYLAAPLGALLALAGGRGLRRSQDLKALALAAFPTAATFVLEHGGIASISSTHRFIAALPLGAAAAWVVVRAARGPHAAIE
jgi:uncharacterized membrane protein